MKKTLWCIGAALLLVFLAAVASFLRSGAIPAVVLPPLGPMFAAPSASGQVETVVIHEHLPVDSTRELSAVPKVLRPNLVTAAQIYSTNMMRLPTPPGVANLRPQTQIIEPDRRALEVCLQDLKLPSHPDAPEECLFQVKVGTSELTGFIVDFEKVVPVRHVFSYSRYAYDGGRGSGFDPSGGWRVHQVYQLDGSVDGTSFVRLAVVDTRPPGFPNNPGSGGGVVGVKIAPKAGSTLGKYRYLRFLVSPSVTNNFGGTFYAEVMAE